MIALSKAFEIARKQFDPSVSICILESDRFWIFGYDWEAMGIKQPVPGVGPLIVYKDTGKYEYPPIPPRMTPQMRQEFKTAAVVHYPG